MFNTDKKQQSELMAKEKLDDIHAVTEQEKSFVEELCEQKPATIEEEVKAQLSYTPDEIEQAHADMVRALAKPGADIASQLTPEMAHLLHMAVGISGEAGELLDAVKKAVIYNKPIDFDNVIEELGDLEFYMQGLRDGLGITRHRTLEANRVKLNERYINKTYNDAHAQARLDKQNGDAEKSGLTEAGPHRIDQP